MMSTMITTTWSHLPLTTTFTPAIDCLTDFWLLQAPQTGSRSLWANLGPADAKCLPSRWFPSSYYSPGIACPSGWAMVANYTSAGEAIGTCCPVYQPSSWTFTTRACCMNELATFEFCEFGATVDMNWTFKHIINPIGTTQTTFPITSGVDSWYGYGVELRWRSTDLTSTPVTAFVSPTTSAVRTTTTIMAMTQEPEEKSPEFSTDAKAGTGVGVGLGVILAILGISFWIRGRKRPWKDGEKERSELAETKKITPPYAIHELDSNPVCEKDGVQVVHPRLKEPAELEGPSARLVDDTLHDFIVPL